jgi:hypothetical protein
MERDEFIELCSVYAAGGLAGDELQRFNEYLRAASSEERELLSELVGTASLLPLALEQRTPPRRVKDALMQKVSLSARARQAARARTATPPPGTPPGRRTWIPLGVAVALGMVLLFSLYALRLLNTIADQDQQLAGLHNEQNQLRTRVVALESELTRKEEMLKVLASRRIEIVVMDGLKTSPVSYGKILWDPERKTAILQVSNLPLSPTDKDYQLWVIKDKKPISAGVFAVTTTEPNYFKIENLAVSNPREIAAFAVTLEPKGGVPQPTGDMYIAGSPRL